MITYVIGDIHGCYRELVQILQLVSFNPSVDTLISCGDFIRKGYDDIGVVTLLMSYNAIPILGNHEIDQLLFCKVNGSLLSTLSNPHGVQLSDSEFIHWLEEQGCLIYPAGHNTHVTHAGVPLHSNVKDTYILASNKLELIWRIYHTQLAASWTTMGIDMFVSMRKCNMQGRKLECDTDYNARLANQHNVLWDVAINDQIYRPWFKYDIKMLSDRNRIIFGHWSLLGCYLYNNQSLDKQGDAICLDTGCVYGNHLSIMSVDDNVIWTIPYNSS